MHAQFDSPVETLSERVRGERSMTSVAPDNRRSDKRFSVSGSQLRVPSRPPLLRAAEIEMRDLLFGAVPSLWMQRREVIDISKGGLAFESRWPVVRGRKLRVQLWVPGHEQPLELSGETRWCKRLLGRRYRVGVQFDAFGDGAGMNPLPAFETLCALEDRVEAQRALEDRVEALCALEDRVEAQRALEDKNRLIRLLRCGARVRALRGA